MTPQAKGLLALFAACITWGVSALYYRMLQGVPAAEVLAHRTLWSLFFLGGIIVSRGRLPVLWRCVTGPDLRGIFLAALTISVNWFGFIYAVLSGHAVAASLGYYMFPLVAVILGVVFYRDRLRRAQWLAVGLAALAVTVLTVGLGVFPAISLMLAVSFGLYGLLKKRLQADPLVTVTAEVLLLSPLALIWLYGVHRLGWGAGAQAAAFGQDPGLSLFLAGSGLLTGVPLILFSYATQRISLPTVGLVQYLNPTLQFFIAVLVLGEPFTPWHAIAFPLIWLGLTIYSLDGWKGWRRSGAASPDVAVIGDGYGGDGAVQRDGAK